MSSPVYFELDELLLDGLAEVVELLLLQPVNAIEQQRSAAATNAITFFIVRNSFQIMQSTKNLVIGKLEHNFK